ncbi:peptide/nickel transport system permease protein [Spinactinospora alkalitolerans]|uniref:Peptide/nickel transport system permease protein n=1 Tax=Spinactinospora alkalitolerans TaxID=687207 RepID=A0A852TUI6_9ACTN|nr:ABC transporter permease [Spinactinospora alkalitolerans]NYE48106.1 peptide/nickel transport system permease protein [Spinactinospora alkalitolerans]
MTSYLVRRCLQAVPLLLGISVIVFALLQMTPGGPMAAGEGAGSQASAAQIERLRGRYGLDDPIWIQYLRWLGGMLTGDWGASFNTGRPVLEAIGERIPTTLLLTGVSFTVSVLLALAVGTVAAVRRHSAFDHLSTGLSFAGLAMPSFWFGLMLLYVFSFQLGWLPSAGLTDLRAQYEGVAAIVDRARHLILPVAVLSLVSLASLIRYVRSSMLEVLGQDYIRTARGSGLPERTVVLGHALKNASIPVVTVAVLSIPELFLGAVITETIFGLPGMGRLFVESAQLRDYPVLLGILIIAALLVVLANLFADIVYSRLDPRISYE